MFIIIMDITKFFERKKRELSSQSANGDDSKRPREESNNSTSTSTSPGDVFEESWQSGDCVKILVDCMKKYWNFNYRKPDQTQDGIF